MERKINKIKNQKSGINVLSLFDGMSCGQIALRRANISVLNYFASEVDLHSIKITQKNYPNTIQLGDVTTLNLRELPEIDLLIGGSPCQGFSNAGKKLNFKDPRSKLFFDYVRIKEDIKPKNFLLENVRMSSEYVKIISNYMNSLPNIINSALFCGQSRVRLYWTDLQIKFIKDRKISAAKNLGLEEAIIGQFIMWPSDYKQRGIRRGDKLSYRTDGKSNSLLTSPLKNLLKTKNGFRQLTPEECELLQTVPENYTCGVSDKERYKMLGNGWTVDVIAHIFSSLKKKEIDK